MVWKYEWFTDGSQLFAGDKISITVDEKIAIDGDGMLQETYETAKETRKINILEEMKKDIL